MFESNTQPYRCFLMRCWREGDPSPESDAPPAWRFMLVEIGREPATQGFTSLESLSAFLAESLSKNAKLQNHEQI